MSSNPETRFSKRFRKLLPKGHQVRVENPAHPGTPDYNDCIDGVEFWIEYKQVKALPKRPETPVFHDALRPEQIVWLHLRHRAKGRCYIVAYVEQEDLIYIVSGEHAKRFNEMTKAELDEVNLPKEEIWRPF